MLNPNIKPEQLLDDVSDLQLEISDINETLESGFLEYIEDILFYCEKYINEYIDLKEENDKK